MRKTFNTVGNRKGLIKKVLLGVGMVAVGGVAMGAAPAMARDRDDHRQVEEHRQFDRHEDFRRDRDDHDRIWAPDRYELQTFTDAYGNVYTQNVLVEPGHWIFR